MRPDADRGRTATGPKRVAIARAPGDRLSLSSVGWNADADTRWPWRRAANPERTKGLEGSGRRPRLRPIAQPVETDDLLRGRDLEPLIAGSALRDLAARDRGCPRAGAHDRLDGRP